MPYNYRKIVGDEINESGSTRYPYMYILGGPLVRSYLMVQIEKRKRTIARRDSGVKAESCNTPML